MDRTVPSTPRVPLRLVLASIAGVWLAYFALTTLRGWLVGLELFDALLLRRCLVTLASMAVTLALWPLVRLLDPRPFWVKVGAVLLMALPASGLLAAINQWAFADIEKVRIAGLIFTMNITARITEGDRAFIIGGRSGDHVAQFERIGWRHDNHIRHSTKISEIERTCMRSAVLTNESGAINCKANRQIL